jgi:hypothetical protein
MVIANGDGLLARLAWQLSSPADSSSLQQLKEQASVTGLAALAGIILLGCFLLAVVWVGARVTRRYMQADDDLKRSHPPRPDDWTGQPRS